MKSDDHQDRAPINSIKSADDDGDSKRPECGFWVIKPACMQPLARIETFVGFISVTSLLSSCLSVYMNSQVTTIEKMFGISSSVSGVIMGCNDFGYLLAIIFTSYLARQAHIPRVMSIATVLYGLSGLMCCIPYFLTRDKFVLGGKTIEVVDDNSTAKGEGHMVRENLCLTDGYLELSNVTCSSESADDRPSSVHGLTSHESTTAVVLIAVGMIIQGFAKSPRYPYVVTYVDDNAQKNRSAFYLGIIFCASIFGPVCAYTLGGLFSRIYVTLEESTMQFRDPRWVGAWWLGFLVFGAAAIVFSSPLLFYPKHLLTKTERREKEKKDGKLNQPKTVKGLVAALLRLAWNPIFVAMVLSQCFHALNIGGYASFHAKYIEVQFTVPAWKASIIAGSSGALAASLGSLVGGSVVSRLKLSPIGIVKMIILFQGIYGVCSFAYLLIGCSPHVIYGDQSVAPVSADVIGLDNMTCLGGCDCDQMPYLPVCDSGSGRTFYSPCHAGCTLQTDHAYGNCTCAVGEVDPGVCPSDCWLLKLYGIFTFLNTLCGAFAIVPFTMMMMRSVDEIDKPLAIGVGSFLSNLLGWMLGPIIYGRLIDSVCLVWNMSCSHRGSCALYDVTKFRLKYYGLTAALRILTVLLKLFALYKMKRMDKFKPQEYSVQLKQNGQTEKVVEETYEDT